jgi:hypothetical protein
MDIIRTKVFAKVDRKVALRVLTADFQDGWSLLFCLMDKPKSPISGCQRLLKKLTSSYCGVQKADGDALTNYLTGYNPLNGADIETCVMGFGTRYPCRHAWIMSVRNLPIFQKEFADRAEQVTQNSFLPGTCNVFSFSVFGALALAVKLIEHDNALDEIAADNPLEPFETKSWSYLHFRINDKDRAKIDKMETAVGAILKKNRNALAKAVKAKRGTASAASGSGARVTFSGPAKKHFKRLGYVFNKAESQQSRTVFDKVTPHGNIIRITAEARGHNVLMPFIDAKFISANFISEEAPIIRGESVATETDLRELLDRHASDVTFFEENLAAIYDQQLGPCHPTITRLLQEQLIRQIE